MSNHCEFTDKQYIKLQELPELVEDGETPQSINIIAYDSNVDKFRPGDRVQAIGIYRACPVRTEPNGPAANRMKNVFNTYLDLISTTPLQEK